MAAAAQTLSDAEALKARGDAAGALAVLEKIQPKTARVEDETGFLLAVLNRGPEARAAFERAIALDPKFAPAHYHLGVAYWLAQDPTRAIAELEAAVSIDPKSFDYRFYLGS